MAFDEKLANRVRELLQSIPTIKLEEKKMFRGLAFMVNDKMCVCISGDELMCRFDPALQNEISSQKGFREMIMKGKKLDGYGYIHPEVLKSKKELRYWVALTLAFNDKAKSSKKK